MEDAESPAGHGAPVEASYSLGFDKVRRIELEAIARRHGVAAPAIANELQGLALSGGGIRSASFALGVVQQLHRAGKVADLHYLSTVSGGGYTGSSLTWFLAMKDDAGKPCFDLGHENFPFIGGPAVGIRQARLDEGEEPADAPVLGRQIVDFIRQRSSYLLPGGGLNIFSGIAVVSRSVLVSLFGYFLVFALLAFVIDRFGISAWTFPYSEAVLGKPLPFFLGAAGLLIFLLVLISIAYSFFSPMPLIPSRQNYSWRHSWQIWAGDFLRWAVILVLVTTWLVLVMPAPDGRFAYLTAGVSDLVQSFSMTGAAPSAASTAAAAGGLGVLGGLLTRLMAQAPQKLWVRLLVPLIPPVSLFLLLVGLGMGGVWLAQEIEGLGRGPGTTWLAQQFEWLSLGVGPVLLLAVFLVYALYANINHSGLHRFYRDRLMETFMPELGNIRVDKANARTRADYAALADMFPEGHQGPYHLINTNVVLLGGKTGRLRSRESEPFVLAPLYCGSDATGFVNTQSWTPTHKWPIRAVGPLMLPTAMAISAAAVNPRTGVGGRGPTRGAAISTLLTILNLRLGVWLPSPRIRTWSGWFARFYPPNFLVPGLTHGLMSFGRNEDATWIELTDGGHFDNTGIYELVRRRVKTIYFVDGTEDPDITFSSLANVAEKVYVDFGVEIDFKDDKASFIDMLKGSEDRKTPLTESYKLARRGYAVGRIVYPPIEADNGSPAEAGFDGILYYLKATLTSNLSAPLYSYKADNPLFPSESTSDQFFSEQQFEAYRALGSHIGAQLTAGLSSSSSGELSTRGKESEDPPPS